MTPQARIAAAERALDAVVDRVYLGDQPVDVTELVAAMDAVTRAVHEGYAKETQEGRSR